MSRERLRRTVFVGVLGLIMAGDAGLARAGGPQFGVEYEPKSAPAGDAITVSGSCITRSGEPTEGALFLLITTTGAPGDFNFAATFPVDGQGRFAGEIPIPGEALVGPYLMYFDCDQFDDVPSSLFEFEVTGGPMATTTTVAVSTTAPPPPIIEVSPAFTG